MLVTEAGRWDGPALDHLIDRAARELTAAGVGPGEPVVLCHPNEARWVAVYLALARIGAVSVPLNAASAVEEVAHVLTDCGARLALLPEPGSGPLARRFPGLLIWPDGHPTGGRAAPGTARSAPDRAATIAYTSGTTGRPKGTVQTRTAVEAGGRALAERLGLGPADVLATALPAAHSYGTNVLNAARTAGATLVLLRRFDETRLLQAVRRERVTVLAGVPTMYRRLLAHPDIGAAAGIRCAVSAGQAAGADLARSWEQVVGGAFVEGWGMTELAGFATLAAPELVGRHGTAGTAVPNVRLRVDTGGLLADPAAGIGELQVAGPSVTPGYLGAATGSGAPDGWLPTGDLGTIDDAGRVRIVGRAKEVVLSGGFTVYPAEVERVLARHPEVREVAVAGVPDPVRGEIVCAWIVPRPGAQPTHDRITAYCRPYLAPHKVPRRIALVPELPLTGTGKIARRELAERYPITSAAPA